MDTVIVDNESVSTSGAQAPLGEQPPGEVLALPALAERCARIPLVPGAWLRGSTLVTPDEAGGRAGRPKINVGRRLSVGDLDHSLTFLQRRTRAVKQLVIGSQTDTEHTTRIVRAAIKDGIRRLSANLPEADRDRIDNAVAKA